MIASIRRLRIVVVVLLMVAPAAVFAQMDRGVFSVLEVHGGVGTFHLLSDIGKDMQVVPNGGIGYTSTYPALMLAARSNILSNHALSVKFNLVGGMMKGGDFSIPDTIFEAYRFRGVVVEASLQLEWNFLRLQGSIADMISQKKSLDTQTRMYLFAGVGACLPFPEFDAGNIHKVTEMDVKSRSVGTTFPVGIGLRTDINPQWAAGIEAGMRFNKSDYVEGYRIPNSTNDRYIVSSLYAIYKFEVGRYADLRKNKRYKYK